MYQWLLSAGICAIVILASLVAAVITNFLPASVRAHFPLVAFLV